MKTVQSLLAKPTIALVTLVVVCCGGGGGGSPTLPPGPTCLTTAAFGAPAASPYALPWEVGESNLLTQSYCNAEGSHHSQLAYDFVMPFGAAVLAARAGIVVEARDQFPDDGIHSQNFNLVIVQHPDGSGGIYAHLRQGSLRVGLGDHVSRGEYFADAGTSGTGLPCREPCAVLHFQVLRTPQWLLLNDVGVNFRNAAGPLDERNGLIDGESYLALEWPR